MFSVSFDDGALVQYSTNNTQFEAGDSLTVTWTPITVYPLLEDYTVDVRLHCFDETLGEPTQSAQLASNIANSGSAQLTIPVLPIPSACVFSILVTTSSLAQICQNLTVPCLSSIWTPPGYYLVSAALSDACDMWSGSQLVGISATLLDSVPPCPPTTMEAISDVGFQLENTLISGTFHPGTSSCYRQIFEPG